VRGKAVLVGYPDVYGDYPINLFDLTRRSIPEIQANAVNTLIEGDYLTPVPVWARGALWFILMSITIAIIVKRRVSQGIAWSVVEFAAIPIAAYGLFRFGWILSCAQLILVFIVALLAGISWRNARSAQRLRVTSHSSYDPRISRRFPA